MKQSIPSSALAHPVVVATTAYNMADALGYLVRVANGVGLSAIAGRLSAVRHQVLDLAKTCEETQGLAIDASSDDEDSHRH